MITASDETQKKFVAEVQKAFEPVNAQVRGLFESGEKALESVSDEAAKAGERFLDNAKNLFNTVQHSDRANLQSDLMERANSMKDGLQADMRALFEKAAESAEPLKSNLRSIALSARDAMDMLESKYLTQDGKDLVRSLVSMASSQFKIPQAIDAPAEAAPAPVKKQ